MRNRKKMQTLACFVKSSAIFYPAAITCPKGEDDDGCTDLNLLPGKSLLEEKKIYEE